jgi:hypothetical protein
VKTRLLSRYALSSCVVAAMLAGCGGSQPPIGALGAMPQTSASAVHVERDGSWMLPEAKSKDLLYVTNYSTVLVFTYPQGKLVGRLHGFFSAAGACVDSKGDVFITNYKPTTVYEYAHGGTKRIASFPTKKAGTVGCAINPVNGDLAITGLSSYVEIFKGARGKPTAIRDKGMWFGGFATYDGKGDLFFLGLKSPKGRQHLSELPSGSIHFLDLNADARIYDEGGIQWDKGYLTALSWVPFKGKHRTTELFRFRVTGTAAHKVDATPLDKPADVVLQYFIDGKTLLAPNLYNSGANTNVLLYDYPAGGHPTLTLTEHITDARGVVISRAQ